MEVDGSMKRRGERNDMRYLCAQSQHARDHNSIGSHHSWLSDLWATTEARFVLRVSLDKIVWLAFCDFALLNRLWTTFFLFLPWLHLNYYTQKSKLRWQSTKATKPDENKCESEISLFGDVWHRQFTMILPRCSWSCLRICIVILAPRQWIYLDCCANWIQ